MCLIFTRSFSTVYHCCIVVVLVDNRDESWWDEMCDSNLTRLFNKQT